MPPQVTTTQLQKRTQIGLSILLGAIIIGLVAGYIYMGMYLAKQGDVESTVMEAPVNTATEESEREAIIRALQENAANEPEVTPEVRAQIIESLEQQAATDEVNEEERQQIIDALQQQ